MMRYSLRLPGVDGLLQTLQRREEETLLTQLQPERNIPSQIYELAARYSVGTPLKRQRKRSNTIVLIFIVLSVLFCIWWIGYNMYGYIAFSILSHTYPDINSVPDNQLENYHRLQAIHDHSWLYTFRVAGPLLAAISWLIALFSAYQTKLYICTDGLLKIYKKKDEAIRWDEVKELYLTKGNVTRLVKQEGSDVFLSPFLVDKRLNTLLIDEVTRCLLSGMLASYERSETVTFGDLEVNQKGIYRPGAMVFWRQVGAIALEYDKLSVYYRELEDTQDERQTSTTFAGKWHTWRKSAKTSASWPNLPIFVALVNTILDQRGANQIEMASHSQHPRTLKEAAVLSRHKKQRKKRLALALTIISILGVLSLTIGIPTYLSAQEQQRAEGNTQILQNYFRQLALQPYAVHVPGEQCGNGKNFWLDGSDRKNAYTCQKDGLLMTVKDATYAGAEWFTLVPDTLSTQDTFSSVGYFPHNYRVQVQATVLSDNQDLCVEIGTHFQHYLDHQSFDVCTGGNWYFYGCDSNCSHITLITSGTFSHASRSYLITVDVTDSVLSLSVDHMPIASVNDATYHSTDQIELKCYGDQLDQVLFSDFSYTPQP